MNQNLVMAIADAVSTLLVPPFAIGVGGAHAKDMADSHSDLDIHVFAEHWPDDERRSAAIAEVLSGAEAVSSWHAAGQAGTNLVIHGQPVEIWFRLDSTLAQTVERILNGDIDRHFVIWTPNGYFDHCLLADLAHLKILRSASSTIGDLIDMLHPFPARLRSAIVTDGLAIARFWNGNLHLQTALEREDAFYLDSIYHQIRVGLLQALFALNETYYPGDKKIAQWLDRLSIKPENFSRLFLVDSGPRLLGWNEPFSRIFAFADELDRLWADETGADA